jgi:hypothetical protein
VIRRRPPGRVSGARRRGPPPRGRVGDALRVAALLFVTLAGGAGWGQGAIPAPAAEVEAPGAVPAIAGFGVQFGFPGFRTAGVSGSLQARFAGLALRVGGGPGGVAIGVQARAYLPLPLAVPTFVGAGFDAYGGRLAPHAVVGVHVPFAERLRLDVEGGVAWVPLLDDRRIVPYLGVGVSYAFAIGLPPGEPGALERPSAGARSPRCQPGPPDPDALDAAVAATVRRFVADAVGTYGSVYRGLRYRTEARAIAIDGDRATMGVAYEGSVIEILTGREVGAAGEAEVDFRWDGCRWLRTALRY